MQGRLASVVSDLAETAREIAAFFSEFAEIASGSASVCPRSRCRCQQDRLRCKRSHAIRRQAPPVCRRVSVRPQPRGRRRQQRRPLGRPPHGHSRERPCRVTAYPVPAASATPPTISRTRHDSGLEFRHCSTHYAATPPAGTSRATRHPRRSLPRYAPQTPHSAACSIATAPPGHGLRADVRALRRPGEVKVGRTPLPLNPANEWE